MPAREGAREIVFLNGFMGAGKSTVGAALARELGVPFVDLDATTTEMLGEPIADAIRSRGEAAFREVESRALVQGTETARGVVALGGGTLLSAANRAVVRARGVVVTLWVSEATAVRRMGSDLGRPLFRAGLLAERASVYADTDFGIDTDGQSLHETVDAIRAWLEGRWK